VGAILVTRAYTFWIEKDKNLNCKMVDRVLRLPV